ncbi:hypothetical protein ACNKHO_05955 [Shigella flexneri]
MNVLAILEHLTHQFIGRPFFPADVFRARDNELHIKAIAKLKQRGKWAAGVETRELLSRNSRRHGEMSLPRRRRASSSQLCTTMTNRIDRPGTHGFPGKRAHRIQRAASRRTMS